METNAPKINVNADNIFDNVLKTNVYAHKTYH